MQKLFLILVFGFFSVTLNAQRKSAFTPKMVESLPAWWDDSMWQISLDDSRTIDDVDSVRYIGAYRNNIGQVYFIDDQEVVFRENDIETEVKGTENIQTCNSGIYRVVITRFEETREGVFFQGTIALYTNGVLQEKKDVFIGM